MAVSPTSLSTNLSANSSLASDARSMDALKASASKDPKAAVAATAKQFEALFMQQLMKSMREASMTTGMFDNEASKMGSEMLDAQYATQMTGTPGGLSEVIARQLEQQIRGVAPKIPSTPATERGGKVAANAAALPANQLDFVRSHSEAAKAAEAATGIPANFMVAQAAHESGWGRRQIMNADGTPSNNLFGIKAGPNWKGAVAEVTTTEYVDGQPRKVMAKFRAYATPADSFADYAQLMKNSPRYTGVLNSGGDAHQFAQGLQRAGYATDPAYAHKLSQVINTTLRLQKAVA